MPTGDDGQRYRSHSQAFKFGKKNPSGKEEEGGKDKDQEAKGAEIGHAGKVMIEKTGDGESGEGEYTVHHADGKKHKKLSHEHMLSHVDQHFGGGGEDRQEMEEDEGLGDLGGGLHSILAG